MNKIFKIVKAQNGNSKVVSELAKGGKSNSKVLSIGALVVGVLFSGNILAQNVELGDGEATGDNSIAIGENADAKGDYSIAIGRDSEANSLTAVAIGQGAVARNHSATAIGEGTGVLQRQSIALGVSNTIGGNKIQEFSTILGHINYTSMGDQIK